MSAKRWPILGRRRLLPINEKRETLEGMTVLDLSSAITVLFIIGMIWLRTRMQYVGLARSEPGRKLRLEKAGRLYFGSAIALLALGWFAAPPVGAALWPVTAANPVIPRVIWFLLCYYVFIVVHRVLKGRGIAVFKLREDSVPS
jgi:hypothetical protein